MRDVVVTRVQCGGPPRRSRNLEERLMVRFTSLYRRLSALVFGLSPGSRLRRAFLRRAAVSGWAAATRRDFKLVLVRYAPDVEVVYAPGMQTLGLGGTFRGHAGLVEGFGKLAEVWDSMEIEPAYTVDLGERLLILGFLRSHARASGVRPDQEFAVLYTVPKRLVTHEQAFLSWEEGLRAAGLDADAIALPSRGKVGQPASRRARAGPRARY
jgi:hypothetical protein